MLKWWLERDPLSITLASQPFSTLSNPFSNPHTQKLRPPRGVDVFHFLIYLWLWCGPLSLLFTSFNLLITPRGDPPYSTLPILAFGLVFDQGERSPRELCPPFPLSNKSYVFIWEVTLHLALARIPCLSLTHCVIPTPHTLPSPLISSPHPKRCTLQEWCALPHLETPTNNY